MNLKAMSLFLFMWEESHHASNKFRCMTFYNPPINVCVILLAILDHVVQVAGRVPGNIPRPRRHLSSNFQSQKRQHLVGGL